MSEPRRDVMLAMRRGFANRCPNCGRGALFAKYLKVRERCRCCKTVLYRYEASYSAELAPAFLVQSVVSIPCGLGVFYAAIHSDGVPWGAVSFWSLASILLSAGSLQPIKGAIVGMQWANRLDDFAVEREVIVHGGEGPGSAVACETCGEENPAIAKAEASEASKPQRGLRPE